MRIASSLLEQADREQQHVVEVDGAGRGELLLVGGEHLGEQAVGVRPRGLRHLLAARAARSSPPRCASAPPAAVSWEVAIESFLSAPSSDAPLVVLVGDREALRQADLARVVAQELQREAVEGADEAAARRAAEQLLDPLDHLARRLVGEGDREHLVRSRQTLGQEPGDPVGEHPRLARAGAGDDEQRPLAVAHGAGLLGVEVGEQVVGGAQRSSGLPPRQQGCDAESGLYRAPRRVAGSELDSSP